jgi:hypothetical protein
MPDVVVGLSEPGAGAWGLLLQGHCQAAREAGDAGSQPGDAHQHSTEGYERARTVAVPAPLQAEEHARISRLLLCTPLQKRNFQNFSIFRIFHVNSCSWSRSESHRDRAATRFAAHAAR